MRIFFRILTLSYLCNTAIGQTSISDLNLDDFGCVPSNCDGCTCVGCQEERTDSYVELAGSLHPAIESEETIEVVGNTVWNCYEGGGTTDLSVTARVDASETLTFSQTGNFQFNLGISRLVVVGTQLGLSESTGTNVTLRLSLAGTGTRPNIPECAGIRATGYYTATYKEAKVIVFRTVTYHHSCTCTLPSGAVVEHVSRIYSCDPFYAKANSKLLPTGGNGAETALNIIISNPGNPPSSAIACNYCENQGGGGNDDDDDLDPNGDEDGDGILNGDDDRPYGYEGDDPWGDDDNDGIPNALDPNPYGYDGDNPWGDDDNDGIPNCQDRSPNGPIFPFHPVHDIDVFMPILWLS